MPEKINFFLNKIQGQIRLNRFKTSWSRTSSMHLTLRFIGDTEKKKVTQIIQAMKETSAAFAPFTLSAEGVGVFPGIKNARVIWAGVGGQVDQLKRLQMTLEKNLEQEGAGVRGDHQRFSPHLTLGRLKSRVDSRTLADMIQNLGQQRSEPCLIKSMVLFKSDLMASGAVHTKLFEAEFSNRVYPDDRI